MLSKTNGLILRTVKYGETSLIVTIFTQQYGVKSFIVQGVRNAKSKRSSAGLLQPSTLLDMVIYYQPNQSLLRLKEYAPAIFYNTLHSDIVKSSIALFCTELLLRLLLPDGQAPELFTFTYHFFETLDTVPIALSGNYPLYFIVMCSRFMGYEVGGGYTPETPYIDSRQGSFTTLPPSAPPYLTMQETQALYHILNANTYHELQQAEMNSQMRTHILEWYIAYLRLHTQHMGNINSLEVLRVVLH